MKTLICIRQFPYSEPTVTFGGLLAQLENSPVTLLTVVDDEKKRVEAETELNKASELLNWENVSKKVRLGDPVAEILKESRDEDYEVVVVGSKDVESLLEALTGTVTGKVAGKAGHTVLVVKAGRPSIERIMISVGGQQLNRAVVENGARIAKAAGARVVVLYVTNPVPTMYTGLDSMDETLQELLQSDTPIANYLHWIAEYLAEQGIDAAVEVVQGVAADEIMREARQGDYDLIVIGAAREAGLLKRLIIEQVTPHVVERAPCPVLVVR